MQVHYRGAPLQVRGNKQRLLLATLLLQGNRVVTTDVLAEALWGAAPPPTARVTIHNYVKRLRDALATIGRDRIATQPQGYLIQIGPGELDVIQFEDLLQAARAAARQGDWEAAERQARAALELWRGDPIADVPSQYLAVREIPRLTEMRLQAAETWADASLYLGMHAEVIAQMQQLVAEAPLRERHHGLLMTALVGAGRQAEALAAYQRARRVLVDELGVEPGQELQDLHQRILTGDLDRSSARSAGVAGKAPARVVPRELPAPPRHFTGRAVELAALTRLLDQGGSGGHRTVVISAIDGTAGVGKTTLALRWAHQVAHSFPDGQLYVNLRGFDPALPPMPAAEAIRLALDALGVPAGRIPASLDAQAGLYRSVLAGKKVLIVADNAADPDQVRPLLPGSPGCLVIVTSRSTLAGLVATDGAVPMSLDVLTSAEARDLLARIVGAGRVAAEPEAAGRLIEACSCLPLALAIAAARAATRPRQTLAAVAAELADAAGRLDALQSDGDPGASVRAALASSYRYLSAETARMLRLLVVHPGPDISLSAAAGLAGVPGQQAARQLAELADASLVSRHGADRYTLHDLVRLYAAEQAQRVDGGTERQAAMDRMLDHYLHTGYAAALLIRPGRTPIAIDAASPGAGPEQPADSGAAESWYEAEHRVLIAVIGSAFAAGQDARAWKIAWTLDDYLGLRGHWHDRLAVQTIALAAAGRLGELSMQASSHVFLAENAAWLSRYDDAESHYGQGLALCRQAGNRVLQAQAHLGLGGLLHQQGHYGRAADHARQALELYTAEGHLNGQANALNGLGWNLAQLGDYEQALVHCRQALALCRKAGGRHIEAITLDSLGYAHHQLGQHAEATDCFQQALDIARQIGFRHQQADSLSHLGDTFQAAGDLQSARTAWQEALAILDDLQHPDAEPVRAQLRETETALLPAAAHRR
jgi:DNA-binding SARP family transcriptional activator